MKKCKIDINDSFYKYIFRFVFNFYGIDFFYISFQLKIFIKIMGLSDHYKTWDVDWIIFLNIWVKNISSVYTDNKYSVYGFDQSKTYPKKWTK